MYLEKTELNTQNDGFIALLNCDDFVENPWANNLDEGIQVVGARDTFKLNAIYQLFEKLSPEPSEILVLCPNDTVQNSFWSWTGIPVVQDLNQIVSVLRRLLQEFRKRQKPFRIFLGHHIICAIELECLHVALANRALELGVEYDARELNEVVTTLRDFGSRIGITVIACTSSEPRWNHCLYSGESAVQFAEAVSQDILEEVRNQAHPCCFAIANDIYLMSVTDSHSSNMPLAIELVPDKKRAIDLQGW